MNFKKDKELLQQIVIIFFVYLQMNLGAFMKYVWMWVPLIYKEATNSLTENK